ncbi:hypothetical protein KSP39_PZI003635 [Platanthera zijinensis]|uniref:Uncharacterized protein n=1 Tax=Platanthera zijinensis TaxID=2320716 RepID=A0AAP0GCV7_9ASPA
MRRGSHSGGPLDRPISGSTWLGISRSLAGEWHFVGFHFLSFLRNHASLMFPRPIIKQGMTSIIAMIFTACLSPLLHRETHGAGGLLIAYQSDQNVVEAKSVLQLDGALGALNNAV